MDDAEWDNGVIHWGEADCTGVVSHPSRINKNAATEAAAFTEQCTANYLVRK